MLYSRYGRFVALGAFVLVSCLHLLWKKNKNITKSLLLPALLLYYLTASEAPMPTAAAALAASWLGDVLLEKSGIKWFTAGGIAFMLSHLLFIITYSLKTDFSAVKPAIIIPAAMAYCAVSAVTINSIAPSVQKNLHFPLFLYLLFNSAMNTFALMHLTADARMPSAVIFIGAILFFISDNCLFIECFHEKKPDLFYPVMVTYIAGEFLIIQGIIML